MLFQGTSWLWATAWEGCIACLPRNCQRPLRRGRAPAPCILLCLQRPTGRRVAKLAPLNPHTVPPLTPPKSCLVCRAVSLPGRALGAAVEKLKSQLPEEQYAVLADFHAAVVQQLRSQGGEGSGGGDVGGEEGGAGRVQELMGAARHLVAAGRPGREA